MASIVGLDGTVNPPPPLESQTFNRKKVRDARGNLVTDKGANGAFLAYVCQSNDIVEMTIMVLTYPV